MDVGSDNFRFTLDDPEKKSRAFRYPMSSELHASSLDRYAPTKTNSQSVVQAGVNALFSPVTPTSSTNDCQIQTKRPLLYGYFNRVALTEMQILLRMPTVVTGYNDRFFFIYKIDGGAQSATSVTVPQGYYTPTQLAATLQVLLRASVGWTTPGSFTVTPPNNGVTPGSLVVQTGFVFNTGTADSIVFASPFDPTIVLTISDKDKLRILRFNRLVGAVVSNFRAIGNALTGVPAVVTVSPNFLPTDYIDVVSKKLTNYKESKDTNTNYQAALGVMGRIYLTDTYTLTSFANSFQDPNSIGPTPLTFTKKWAIPNWSQWSPNQSIDTIDITLLDMWGSPLPWDNTVNMGTEWEMTILASE